MAKSDRIKGVKGTPYDKPLFVLVFLLSGEKLILFELLSTLNHRIRIMGYTRVVQVRKLRLKDLKEYNEKVT